MPSPEFCEPKPIVEERFVVKPRFGPRIVRMLNADGHIDIAHKMGLVSLKTDLLHKWVEEIEQTNDENEKFVSRTHWCIVRVTATVKAPDGRSTITCDGISCVNDRDKFVKQPGYEIAVAETRAIKRALANACNITEKYISPDAREPTRETIDMPLPKSDEVDEKPGLPADVLRKPDITPPIEGIKQRDSNPGDQFDFS